MPDVLPFPFPFLPQYIFTDIDDTLTWHGRLPVQTFYALEALREHGIQVIPVTGACSAWCDCIVRTWPVSTIIGENGAVIMSSQNGFTTEYLYQEEIRRENRETLLSLAEEIQERIPGAKLTHDTAYRDNDIAFDIGQDHSLTREQCQKIIEICRANGANARMSSIHINVWYGAHSKATTTNMLLRRLKVPAAATIFVGDSANDEDMFKLLDTTVGVANIKPFLGSLTSAPSFITSKPGGLGFAELAEAVLQRRRTGDR
jgi:HAD superfamily hydrolase (TIGR01484 family)